MLLNQIRSGKGVFFNGCEAKKTVREYELTHRAAFSLHVVFSVDLNVLRLGTQAPLSSAHYAALGSASVSGTSAGEWMKEHTQQRWSCGKPHRHYATSLQ